MYTSKIAETTNNTKEIIIKLDESKIIFPNLFVEKLWWMTATEIMLPARPAVRYAIISGIP